MPQRWLRVSSTTKNIKFQCWNVAISGREIDTRHCGVDVFLSGRIIVDVENFEGIILGEWLGTSISRRGRILDKISLLDTIEWEMEKNSLTLQWSKMFEIYTRPDFENKLNLISIST